MESSDMRLTDNDVKAAIAQIKAEKPLPAFKTQNRPIVNLLQGFVNFYNAASDPAWVLQLENCDRNPSQRGFDKDGYFTHLVGALILDFETYLKYAIWMTSALAGRPEIVRRMKSLPPRTSIVDHLFNNLPRELHPDLPIAEADPDAAMFFRTFYKEVRNEIFHGNQIMDAKSYDFLCFLEWYRRGYEWLASWGTLELYLEFDGEYSRIKEKRLNPAPYDDPSS